LKKCNNLSEEVFLSTGGTSTGAKVADYVAGWLCVSLQTNMFGDIVLTRKVRLSPDATILVYRDKATVQVYISSFTTGPSKVHVLQISKPRS
jgi:hypothetical protein